MNIQKEKQGLIEWISSLNDATVIETLKKVKGENADAHLLWNNVSVSQTNPFDKGFNEQSTKNYQSQGNSNPISEMYL